VTLKGFKVGLPKKKKKKTMKKTLRGKPFCNNDNEVNSRKSCSQKMEGKKILCLWPPSILP
jgi:hypothetical protein